MDGEMVEGLPLEDGYYYFRYYIPSSLKRVTVTDTEAIDAFALRNCGFIEIIIIDDTVTSVGGEAFFGCTALAWVYYMGTEESWSGISVGGDNAPLTDAARYYYSEQDPGKEGDFWHYGENGDIVIWPEHIHNLVFGETVTEAGCDTNGEALWKCESEKCGYTESKVIPAAHSLNEDGVCTVCGALAVSEGIEYTLSINRDYYIVTGYGSCTDTTVVIADMYNGLPVKEIAQDAFYGNHSISSIVIQRNVLSIGESAFNYCTSLTSVTIGNSVTSIGNYAFYGCTALEKIYFNATAMNDLNSNNYVFYDAGQNGNGIEVVIGANVKKIPAYLFCPYSSSNSPKIASVEFEEGSICESIGYNAFRNCTSLTSVTISNSVTSIGDSAFYDCTSLASVTIPDSVTSIGGSAFYRCTSLESVTIGNSVTSIGDYAFYGCKSLTSITIPDSVTTIGNYAFQDCKSLASITIPDSVTTIGNYAFLSCYKLVEVYNLSNLTITKGSSNNGYVGYYALNVYTDSEGEKKTFETEDGFIFYEDGDIRYLLGYKGNNIEITLPESCNGKNYAIYEYAFYHNDKLTSLTIPDSVTSIGDYAFYGCKSLTSITIPDSVTSIGDYAFYGCKSLTSITIPDSVTSIGNHAFYDCTSLASVTIPFVGGASLNDTSNMHFGYIFGASSYEYNSNYVPSSLKTVVITGGSSIGSCAFEGCDNLTSVTIPDSVTSIGDYAFYGCTALEKIYFNATAMNDLNSDNYVFYDAGQNGNGIEVVIGANVKKIPAYLFCPYSSSNSPKIASVEFEEGSICENIGSYAFYGCTSLTSVTIPDSVTSIGASAFSGCDKLASVTIPDSVTSIGASAFSGCDKLASVTIPDSVTSIDNYTFRNCTSLASVTIGNSVTSIGSYAFSDCDKLASVTIPNSVTSICNYAFYGCTALEKIYFNATAMNDLNSDNYVFYDAGQNGNGIEVVVRANVKKIPAYLFCPYSSSNSPKIASVEFEEGSICENIGSYAFYGCTSLTSVTIPDSVTSIGTSAFRNCTSLASVTIPNSVTSIGWSAFYGCSGITSITIPDSVTTIGGYAFSGCSSLTSVTIGNSVTKIGDYAFQICYKLVEVYNLSGLTITKGGEDNGFVGFYALNVYTDTEGEKKTFETEDGFIFYEDGDIRYLLGYKGNNIEITLPESCNGKDYEIYKLAFYRNYKLASVTIPNKVTSIGSSAFYDCTSLESVTIGNSVTSIGTSAFEGCYKLASITIPFVGSASLNDTSNMHFGYIFGASSYEYNSNYVPSSLKTVVITGGSSIGSCAFEGCDNITSVTIGNDVTSIGNYAFRNCTSLASVTIPDSVTSIGSYAFYGCTALEKIYFNATAMNDLNSDNYVFYDAGQNGNGIEVVIGANVKKIPAYFFRPYSYSSSNSPKIASVEFEEGSICENIGSYAFYGCTSLTSVTIPDSVTSIGGSAFSGCDKLASVTIPDSVTSIGGSAFYRCTSLESVTIGNSVTSIGDYAFYDCTSLASVTIPNSVTSIGDYAFSYCTSLASVTIPDSVTSIGDEAFYRCTSLESVTIGNSVTSIGDCAFYDCTSLASVTIPDSVTSIGSYAFSGCTSLESVYYAGTAEDWNEISIGDGSSCLTDATRYYYSENEPTEDGNFWHYDEDGNINIWGLQ